MIVTLIRPFSFRGKARLLDRFVPRSGVVDTTLFGYSVSLDLGDHIQRLMYMNAYERELGTVLQEWIRPGMTVIDVGANAGYFTLLAARGSDRSGRVIAVEPSPWVADRLEHTLERNHLTPRVLLERMALGSTIGVLPLVEPVRGNHTPSLLDEAHGRPTNDVPVGKLDDYLPTWTGNVGVVDVMKVDIEGYEPLLIEGGATVLAAGRVKRIAIEANREWLAKTGHSPEGMRQELEELGFRLEGVLDPGSGNETFLMQHRTA